MTFEKDKYTLRNFQAQSSQNALSDVTQTWHRSHTTCGGRTKSKVVAAHNSLTKESFCLYCPNLERLWTIFKVLKWNIDNKSLKSPNLWHLSAESFQSETWKLWTVTIICSSVGKHFSRINLTLPLIILNSVIGNGIAYSNAPKF